MIGFKQINDFTLWDCYTFLKEQEGYADYEEVKARYEIIVKELKKQEDADFNSCKTIANYISFIDKYKVLAPAYEAQHIDEAKTKIEFLTQKAKEEEEKRRRIAIQEEERIKKRRKRFILISASTIIIAAIVVFFIGYTPVKYLNIDDVEFGKEGGSKTIRIKTNVSSNSIKIDEPMDSWFSFTRDGLTLTITTDANPDPEKSGKITVTAYSSFFGERLHSKKITKTIIIKQRSGYATKLNVSKTSFDVGKYGSTYQINVKTDGVKLSLKSGKDWIKCVPKNESHDGTYYHNDTYDIVVEKNYRDGDRTGKIIVESGGRKEEIIIRQASGLATKLDVEKTYIGKVDKSGAYYYVDVTTDGLSWNATTSYSWLELSEYSNKLGIRVARNYDEIKTGYIYVRSNNGHEKCIKVEQDGSPTRFYADKSSWTFDTNSDYDYISFTNNSNQTVSVSTDKGWLSASISNGNKVRISCDSNNNSPRDGKVTLSCGDKKAYINVHQYGYKDVACSHCVKDMWGNPTGNVYVGIFGTPSFRIEPCSHCGGRKYIKQKVQY